LTQADHGLYLLQLVAMTECISLARENTFPWNFHQNEYNYKKNPSLSIKGYLLDRCFTMRFLVLSSFFAPGFSCIPVEGGARHPQTSEND